jgi:hypothetical protein
MSDNKVGVIGGFISLLKTRTYPMRFNVSLAAVILLFTAALHSQTPTSKSTAPSHNLSAERELFEHYSHDFQEIASALPAGDEGSKAAVYFRDTSLEASYDAHAAHVMLTMYDQITGSGDRERVKPILVEALHLYAWRMNEKVDHVSGFASLVKNAEVVQMALKMKDDLRSANQMFESLAASIK